MGAAQIREELHQLINTADDRLLNLIYDVMIDETREEDFLLSEDHKKILDQRLADHKANPSEGIGLNEVKAQIQCKV